MANEVGTSPKREIEEVVCWNATLIEREAPAGNRGYADAIARRQAV